MLRSRPDAIRDENFRSGLLAVSSRLHALAKANADACSGAVFPGFQFRCGTMALGDFGDDGESKPAAALAAAKDAIEALKYALAVLRFDAGPVVFHAQFSILRRLV